MALQSQTLTIPFAQGVDTKTDVKQVPEGKLLVIENGYFQEVMAIRKRPGYAQLGNQLSAGRGISSYKDELVSLNGTDLYSFSSSTNQNFNKGKKLAADLNINSVISNTYEQTVQDSAYLNGLYCYVWQDTRGGVRYSIVDSDTMQSIVNDVEILSTGFSPKVKAFSSHFVIVFGDTTNSALRYVSINISTPTVLPAINNLTTNFASTDQYFDVCVSSSRMYVVYNTTTATTLGLRYFDTSFVVSAETAVAIPGVLNCVTCFFSTALSQLWVSYGYSNLSLGYFVRDVSLGAVLAPTFIESVVQNSGLQGPYPKYFTNVTGLAVGGSARIYAEVYVTSDGITDDPPNYYTRVANLTNGGSVSGNADFVRSVGLASKAFLYNGVEYVFLAHESELQPMYFLADENGVVGVKVAPYVGGGLSARSHLSEVNEVSSTGYQFAYLIKSSITNSSDSTLFSLLGVNSALVTFDVVPDMLEVANNLHISGGILSMYDGANVVEHGFNLYPEGVEQTPGWIGGGIESGTYSYSAIYTWVDNQGQLHRSAPSVPIVVEVASGSKTYQLTATTINADPTITLANGQNTAGLIPGMLVTGIPMQPNARVQSITDLSNFELTLGATGTNATPINLDFEFRMNTAPISISSTGISVPMIFVFNESSALLGQVPGVFVTGQTSALSDKFYATSVEHLKVGMGFLSSASAGTILTGGAASPPYTITAIDGNVVTCSANLPATNTQSALFFYNYWTGNTTVASSIISNVPSYVFTDGLVFLGQQIASNAFASPPIVTAFDETAQTITVNAGASLALTGVDMVGYLPGSVYAKVGQKFAVTGVSGAPVSATTYITEIESSDSAAFRANGYQQVTLNERTLVSQLNAQVVVDYLNVNCVEVKIPTLRVTQKMGQVPDAQVVLYRTEKNGTLFYQVSSFTNPPINDPSVDYISITDYLNDLEILSRNQLYTTGGEVENIPAPALRSMTSYRNRIIGIPCENPLQYTYTKQVIPTTPAEFSSLLFLENIDQRIGQARAVAAMDDKLILFGANNIFYTVGDGPTPAGTNNDFIQAQLISSDTGTVNKNSTLLTPLGVIYQSANGIYLLQRDLSVNYIGADVEDYNSSTVTSAKLVPGYTHFRVTLSTSEALVYDYYVKQWSVFTNISAVGATIFNNKYTYIRSSGLMGIETPGFYTDFNAFIKLKIVTAWMKFAKYMGFQRIWQTILSGEYKSAHELVVDFYYNFSTTSGQTITFTPDPLVEYEYILLNKIQACESLKISIEDSQVSPFGEGYSLSALAFEVGIKQGLNKLPAAQSYG